MTAEKWESAAALRFPYVSVDYSAGPSYGGSQRCDGDRGVQRWGCGIIAAADLLLYLQRTRKTALPMIAPRQGPLSPESYRQITHRLRREYFPLIPGFGLNCLVLTAGLNRLLRRGKVPLRARWGTGGRQLWDAIAEMLRRDLPVILCIGQSFPGFWRRTGVKLYTRGASGLYTGAAGARAHYVVVTGVDRRWLRISSWGREYYISRRELQEYMETASNPLLTNIVRLSPVPRGGERA